MLHRKKNIYLTIFVVVLMTIVELTEPQPATSNNKSKQHAAILELVIFNFCT